MRVETNAPIIPALAPGEGVHQRLYRAAIERKARFARLKAPAPKVADLPVEPAPSLEPYGTPIPVITKSLDAVTGLAIDDAPIYPHIGLVIRLTAEEFGKTVFDLKSDRRTDEIVLPRHVAMYLCKKMTLRSYPEIGRRLGDRDHTTVIHGVKKMAGRLRSDPDFAERVQEIERRINAAVNGFGGTTIDSTVENSA